MMRGFFLGLALATLAGPAISADAAKAPFQDRNGKPVGNAVLTQTPHGVLIAIALEGLPPGEHGFHIHERGQCDAADGFESAGGHYAPAGHPHGFMAEGGPHAGDMPNLFVSEQGQVRAHVLNPRVSLAGKEAPLLDQDGSALVAHAKADDYRSQPSGAAGDRIACAVVQPATK